MSDALLVFNAGSSSLRCAVYASASLEELCRAHVEAVGTPRQSTSWSGPLADPLRSLPQPRAGDHATLTAWMLDALRSRLRHVQIGAVGHRVVHGGTRFDRPVPIDDAVIADIERLIPLAPQHQPQSLAAIRTITTNRPQLTQIACFDTAFHRRAPRLAQLFALPRELADAGIVRYGFHGLSYEYLAGKLHDLIGVRANGRVILAHLGHGASLCALRDGTSVATSMGFSALDGLMMGTRCGAIDPGVLLHLQQEGGYDVEKLADLLYNRSGLLGVSGLSDDLRVLERSDDPRACEAMDLFAYRAVREIGSLAAALGGLDALVFSAGVGERSAAMRERICRQLGWLGIALDATANAAHATQISRPDSMAHVFVIPTDEELTIARAARNFIHSTERQIQ